MDKHCDGCKHKDSCKEVYEKLGQHKGPNIAFKAIMAFVVPVVVFVLAALAVGPLLKNKIENVRLVILIQLAAGLAAAGVVVFIVRHFERKNQSVNMQCPEKEKH